MTEKTKGSARYAFPLLEIEAVIRSAFELIVVAITLELKNSSDLNAQAKPATDNGTPDAPFDFSNISLTRIDEIIADEVVGRGILAKMEDLLEKNFPIAFADYCKSRLPDRDAEKLKKIELKIQDKKDEGFYHQLEKYLGYPRASLRRPKTFSPLMSLGALTQHMSRLRNEKTSGNPAPAFRRWVRYDEASGTYVSNWTKSHQDDQESAGSKTPRENERAALIEEIQIAGELFTAIGCYFSEVVKNQSAKTAHGNAPRE